MLAWKEASLKSPRAWSTTNMNRTNRASVTLDGSVVTPGFAYNIARYYPSASEHFDKEKCVEIMEKLGMASDPVKWYSPADRPQTASPRERSRPKREKIDIGSFTRNPEVFYLTTNRRDFAANFGPPSANARPKTSRIFPSRDKSGRSTYETEYCKKHSTKEAAVRTGSSSGNRRNNPHPSEAFMIWKFPSRLPSLQPTEISTKDMEEVNKDQLRSTYQSDFTGIPQGVNIQTVFEGSLAPCIAKPPYTLDSTARYSYQKPAIKDELMGNSSRYGCNKNKYQPAVGSVPTVSYKSPQMHLISQTHYTSEFGETPCPFKSAASIRYKSAPIPALEEYLKTAKPHEKASLVEMLKAIAKKDNRESQDPNWLSEWTGPI